MADYNLIPSDRILARLNDELSTYSANGVIDDGKLFTQLKWFAELLNIAVFEQEEAVLHLKNYQAELPCNFYLLDSAWLCDPSPSTTQLNFQSKMVVYTEIVDELVCNQGNCYLPNTNSLYPVSVMAANCGQDRVLDKTTIKEYINSNPASSYTWRNPVLMSLNNKKSVKSLCSKDCQCLFASSPYEISLSRKGSSTYLSSVLKDPIIYIKYYSYPYDEETGLPLVPDNAILEEGLFKHLVYYFLKMAWTNGDDTNMENKIKFWKDEAESGIANAIKYGVFPTYNGMIATTKRMRHKFSSFEIMNVRHR